MHGDIKQLCLDYDKSCQVRVELARTLEDLGKEKLNLKNKVLLLREDLKSKSEATIATMWAKARVVDCVFDEKKTISLELMTEIKILKHH